MREARGKDVGKVEDRQSEEEDQYEEGKVFVRGRH